MSSQSYIYNPTERTLAAAGDGFSCPRLTTVGRTSLALTAGDSGMMVYDTTLNNLFIWTGAAWESVPASGDAGANGAVQYNDNGVVTGAANFFWDKANNRAGVNVPVPSEAFDVAGNIKLTGNIIVANAKGIDFSATPQPAGMTSELLNDYEEGTWTPTIGDAASGGNQATTATAVGRYTKVGRLVTVQWEATGIDTTGLNAGNSLNIRGLPYSSSSATTQFGIIAVAMIAFTGYLTPGVFSGSGFPIYIITSGGTLADVKVSAATSGTAAVYGTMNYII